MELTKNSNIELEELTQSNILIKSHPDKVKYRPGDSVDYKGLIIELDGEDVTKDCTLEPEEGQAFKRQDNEIDVKITYNDALTDLSFKIKKKKNIIPFIIILMIALLGVLIALAGYSAYQTWVIQQPKAQPMLGSELIDTDGLSDEEVQEILDKQAKESRITVNIAPIMYIQDRKLRVNFIVVENNPYSERMEVRQGDNIVYSSEIVKPGNKVEWADIIKAEEGQATVTIYAVDENDNDVGSPVAVEVKIEAVTGEVIN